MARIAVLLSSYNGDRYISEQLDSLLSQDIELDVFIRDDGSSDNTLNLLEQRYEERVKKIIVGENKGVVGSFFDLLLTVSDEYDFYSFCDQDDVWSVQKLSRAMRKLEGLNGVVLYCCRLEYVDDKLETLGYSSVPKRIGFGNALVENIATGCTCVINQKCRNEIIRKIPRNIIMHDWWLYLYVSCFGRLIYDEQPLIKYRQHADNVVGVQTTVVGEFVKRLKRFFGGRQSGVFLLSSQAESFKAVYSAQMSKENLSLISSLVDGKTSLYVRVRLILTRRLWRQKRIDSIILIVLILINAY